MRGGQRTPNQLVPQIMGDPSKQQMIKTEASPGKPLNSAEIAASFFGDELVPPVVPGSEMMSPPPHQMGPPPHPMGPPLTSPVMVHPGKPHFAMKPRMKHPQSPLADGIQANKR